MSFASIEQYNGQPAIMVDGHSFPPMAMTTHIKNPDYMRELGKNGIRIFGIMCNTNWLRPGGRILTDHDGKEYIEKSGFEAFCEQAEMLLEAVPEAYILVRIGLHPPVDWVNEHPDDIMRYSDGNTIETHMMSEVHEDVLPGMYSMCSEAWRSDGEKALLAFCDAVEKQHFADRVIGYFLAAGGTSEWYYMTSLTDLAGNRVADVSPSFRIEFGKYLKEKYKTEEVLRKAWNMPDASFENPIIPNIDSRLYSHADESISEKRKQKEYDLLWAQSGENVTEQPPDANIGVFLNANDYIHVADFYAAWNIGSANSVVHFARAIKENYAGKLVGAFYGAYGCTNYFDNGTTATLRVLNSGVVDFLASPGDYINRQPGGYVPHREIQDSFRLRNMLFTSEEDSRTHLDDDLVRDAMQYYTIEDSLNILKRDFARNLCEDTYAWWFDQFRDGGRYGHQKMLELFSRQQEISRCAYDMNRVKNSEIALIYDQDSLHYVSQETSKLLLELYRATDLGRIGAPVDYYFHDDLARDDMPDYKLYLMINTFVLSDRERESIRKKATKNNAVVVWLYAPGFFNPERTPRMDNAYIEEMIGMKIGRIDDTLSPRFKLTAKEHPALRLGDRGRLYGCIDRNINDCFSTLSIVPLSIMNPVFYIDDPDAEILGSYCINDLPAFALKKQPGEWVSVYCAPHILRSDLIASLAEYAGCHIYSYDDDCIYANRNFVNVHAAYSGKHTIYFPIECCPYEVYENRYYGKNIKKLELDMLKGENLMFCLTSEC